MAKPRPYRERKWLVFQGSRENAIDGSFIVVGRCVKNSFELDAVWVVTMFRVDNEVVTKDKFLHDVKNLMSRRKHRCSEAVRIRSDPVILRNNAHTGFELTKSKNPPSL
jgi:hypothetical protein